MYEYTFETFLIRILPPRLGLPDVIGKTQARQGDARMLLRWEDRARRKNLVAAHLNQVLGLNRSFEDYLVNP